MARFTCFLSTLLVGKKKSSKESTKSFHNKQPTGTENPKIKPEELFLEASPNKTVPNADVSPKNPVPNADVGIKTICKQDPEKDEKLSTNKNPPKPDLLTSPKILKRSCSNIERKTITNSLIKKPHSYDDLKNLTGQTGHEFVNEMKPDSPLSINSCLSADKIMLKKRSSSQVLPSRSRKLWWRLFMFSHRNLHISQHEYINEINNYNSNSCENNGNKGGYSSDTLEIVDVKKNNDDDDDDDDDDDNHWVAFNAETSYFDRVNAWVNSIPNDNNDHDDDDYDSDKCDNDTVCREIGESSGKDQIANSHKRRGIDEISQANNIIQSLNIISSVAHIAGMGLKVVPAISSFTSLKAVNLSNNFIVNISGGALPKSLHTLDLSRNKIGVIEGLRELTRLRVLDLSYNKISRIGHGLSNCTAIKELYLAGNKISNVEGLHRLLKLAVLDLSFNKITTTKSLGQLVANYNSLLALNILGNPIQTNIGDDQVKKSVLGLLPKLSFLNKQLIKEKRGREVAVSDRVAKAALGNGFGGSSRRKLTRRVSQNGSGSVRGVGARSDNKGKSRYRK